LNELMVIGLIGEEGFTRILIGLPDDFFGFHRSDQEALWKFILLKINEGTREVEKLISYALVWIRMFQKAQIIGISNH
jgi:hypothetical protein